MDLIIIGAGTAGLTAAIYGARAGLSVEVIEQTIYGGQIITTTSIENYPGMPGISGADFATALYKQAVELGVKVSFETIQSVQLDGETKTVETKSGSKQAKSIIIATGAKPRQLGCPGEEKLTGRGVSYCATCDGAMYKGKKVVVVGGGNTAIEDAMVLSGLSESVTVIHRRKDFRAERHALEQVRAKENVNFITEAEVTEIIGDNKVNEIQVTNVNDGTVQTIPVDGVFIAVGSMPDNQLFEGQIDLDKTGYIVADESCRTNIPGVFVAGDTRTKEVRQIVTAAADGAVAALKASEHIMKMG